MNAAQAKRLVRVCAWLLVLSTVAALAGLIWTLPPGQRKDGLLGMGVAVVVLGGGLYAIYRVAKAMEREDARVEAEHDRRG